MKQILIILGLFASVTTFAQSPRIKLNQITKDTVKGSVLISSPSDSGMVYSRDFYVAYGADTVLILYGDTLAATSGIISSVLSDGVTITGDGTSGNELKVDTATVISTIQGLVDSLANYVTLSGTETITGAKTFTSDLNVDAKIALNAGDNNIVIGDGAGASLVSGQGIRNVLIGTESGRLINSGDDNVANGYRVLYNDTSGSHNIGVGSYALYLNESGSYNIANGGLSLYANETGNGNIANGFYALHNNLSGSYNIANAFESLYFNTSGNYNIGSGFRALYSLNSGSDNQAYGYQAGRFLSDGSTALTNATNSLFLGSNTRASANGNSNEIVIGTNAIGNGSNSVTIGASTNELVVMKGRMELNDGGNSVFIGDDAGRVDDGSDNRNVGIGYQALYSNTTGFENTANGSYALYFNTTGYQNTANGYTALYNLSSGNNNQAYGYRAGRYLADYSNLTSANNSIFIGTNTRASADGNSNEIVIGTDAIGNGSNTITIGSSTTLSLHTRNYEFDIDQTVGGATDNYVLTYDSLDGQISLEPISLSGSSTLDFGSTSAQSSSDLTITVTGAADGDVVSLGVPNASVNANTNYTAWVSAANTVTVRFNNYSSGAVDPASGTFKVKVFK